MPPLHFETFKEPRGVMRILQFIFAICAFASTVNFTIKIVMACDVAPAPTKEHEIEYPFRFLKGVCLKADNQTVNIAADVSTDAQFYVATGVLSMLYCIFIVIVYLLADDFYKSKSEVPLADFMLTAILAIFWLSGSAAWANGTNALKTITDPISIHEMCTMCQVTTTSFSRLNISLIIGFLNFFLWTSSLWFLYKETIWFHGKQQQMQQQQQHMQQQQQQMRGGGGGGGGGIPQHMIGVPPNNI